MDFTRLRHRILQRIEAVGRQREDMVLASAQCHSVMRSNHHLPW